MPTAASTTMIIGAIARIGIVCEAMIHGIRLRSSVARCTMPTAISDAERRAEGEAEQRRGERHPGVVDEAALAVDGFARKVVSKKFDGDLVRRRQRRLRLRQRLAEELDHAGRLAGAAVEIALERRVQDDREDVPDDDQPREQMVTTGTSLVAALDPRLRLNPHRYALRAGPRARARRSPGTPASRGCRAAAPSAASIR